MRITNVMSRLIGMTNIPLNISITLGTQVAGGYFVPIVIVGSSFTYKFLEQVSSTTPVHVHLQLVNVRLTNLIITWPD